MKVIGAARGRPGPGDRILTGRAEYGSNVLAYWQAARRAGAEVIVVPSDAHGQLDTAALAGLVDERVKLIGVSHVPTSGGLVQPGGGDRPDRPCRRGAVPAGRHAVGRPAPRRRGRHRL